MEMLACAESLFDIIEPKICVRAPYFALENLHVDAKSRALSAYVLPQTPSLFEAGPIISAEAGRHLAILGLCALANESPANERCYYLAHRAVFQRRSEQVASFGSKVRMTALAEWTGSRNAKANAFVWWSNEIFASLNVDYKVLSEHTFERIFRKHKQNGFVQTYKGTYSRFPEMSDWGYEPYEVSARIEEVRPEWCSGHFHYFPALPVAIIMGCLTKLIEGYLIRNTHVVGEDKFVIENGVVEAEDLAFAGTSVLFQGTLLEHHDDRLRFICRAYSPSGQTFGRLDAIARLVKRGWNT